jgi:hypothetical protein
MRFFIRVVLVFSVFIYPLFAQQPPVPAPDSLVGRGIQLRRDLSTAIQSKDEKKISELSQALFALDTDKMPSEWQQAFIKKQLEQYDYFGDWKGMLVIKNRLMNKKRTSKTTDLADADLLLWISLCYISFPPPRDLRKNDGSPEYEKFAHEYAEKNYRDDKEREKIFQYIVDNFDPNYAPVYMARGNLAGVQFNLGKKAQAYANYLICDSQDLSKLYCLPKADLLAGKVHSAKEVLEDEYSAEFLKQDRETIWSGMLRITEPTVVGYDTDKAIEALRKLRTQHLNNTAFREKLEARLRELSLQSDLIIPAEEMGLPQVTTGTLTTSPPLTAVGIGASKK